MIKKNSFSIFLLLTLILPSIFNVQAVDSYLRDDTGTKRVKQNLPPPGDSSLSFPDESGGFNPPGESGNLPSGPSIGPPTQNRSIEQFSNSPWFSFIAGCASILGLILTIYTIQLRHIPTSIFKTLIWKKTLLMSFGTGLIVSSGIQFYNQILEPSGEFFGRIYALLHGKTSFLKYGTGGTNLWGILMILGMTILVFGIWEDPLQKIKEKLLKEIKENQEIQAGEIDKILHDHTYEQLNDIEKEQYDQILRYYQLVNITMIGLLTGYPVVLPELRGTSDIATSARIDEFLSFLNIAVGSRRRKSRSNKDINQSN